jgi:prepilin-type N-terminal cleavage/methylation domain-containing protein
MKNLKLKHSGFSLVELIIVILVIGIIASIAIPNLMKARLAANETSAVSTLRTICTSQYTQYAQTNQSQFFTLTELGNLKLVDDFVAAGQKSGYSFNIITFPKTSSAPARFDATAIPLIASGPTITGNFSYLLIESGQINYQVGNNPPTADIVTRVISNGYPLDE